MKKSQKQRVLEFLKTGQVLRNVDAISNMKILRLSERCRELKADGHNIETVRLTNKQGRPVLHVGYGLVK